MDLILNVYDSITSIWSGNLPQEKYDVLGEVIASGIFLSISLAIFWYVFHLRRTRVLH